MSVQRNQLRETSRLTTNILQVSEQSLVAKSTLDAEVGEKNQLLDLIAQANLETKGLRSILREEANNDKKLEELQNAVQFFTLRMRRDLVKRTISLRKDRDVLHEQIALSQYCRLGIEAEYTAFLSCVESYDASEMHGSQSSNHFVPCAPRWDARSFAFLTKLKRIWTNVSNQSTITKNIADGLLACQGLSALPSISAQSQQQLRDHREDFSKNPFEYDLNDFLKFAKAKRVSQESSNERQRIELCSAKGNVWPDIMSLPIPDGMDTQPIGNIQPQTNQTNPKNDLDLAVSDKVMCNQYISQCIGPLYALEQALSSQRKLLECWNSLAGIAGAVMDDANESAEAIDESNSPLYVSKSVLLGINDALFTNIYVQITILLGVEESLVHILSSTESR